MDHEERTADYTVGDSSVDQECESDSECSTNMTKVSDLDSSRDAIEPVVRSECELESVKNMNSEINVSRDHGEYIESSRSELCEEMDNIVDTSLVDLVDSDMSDKEYGDVGCDRDTILFPLDTSSPTSAEQRSDWQTVSERCSVLGGESVGSCHEPFPGQRQTRWSLGDRKPPDKSASTPRSLYRNVLNVLLGTNSDRTQIGPLQDI
jgi:hypothetical protein